MEKKKLKKLTLNKDVVSRLENEMMHKVKGGTSSAHCGVLRSIMDGSCNATECNGASCVMGNCPGGGGGNTGGNYAGPSYNGVEQCYNGATYANVDTCLWTLGMGWCAG